MSGILDEIEWLILQNEEIAAELVHLGRAAKTRGDLKAIADLQQTRERHDRHIHILWHKANSLH